MSLGQAEFVVHRGPACGHVIGGGAVFFSFSVVVVSVTYSDWEENDVL